MRREAEEQGAMREAATEAQLVPSLHLLLLAHAFIARYGARRSNSEAKN